MECSGLVLGKRVRGTTSGGKRRPSRTCPSYASPTDRRGCPSPALPVHLTEHPALCSEHESTLSHPTHTLPRPLGDHWHINPGACREGRPKLSTLPGQPPGTSAPPLLAVPRPAPPAPPAQSPGTTPGAEPHRCEPVRHPCTVSASSPCPSHHTSSLLHGLHSQSPLS